jgi:hypothetical protein
MDQKDERDDLLDAVTRLGQRTFKCKRTIGTRSAQSIRASGLTCRINRPDM